MNKSPVDAPLPQDTPQYLAEKLVGDTASAWLTKAATAARLATRALAQTTACMRDAGLSHAAASLRRHTAPILAANATDLVGSTYSGAFRDRLTLTVERVEAMAAGVEAVARLPDPLARSLGAWTQPNGLQFERLPVPIGVIGMIYESRPNVGADAAALCLKSGNAVILRGGSESFLSSAAIHAALLEGLGEAGLPPACVQIAPGTDRDLVAAMLAATGMIDLIIPRGGRGLVERVQREAHVAVLAHAEGLCHTFIHEAADPGMARAVVANAKMRRTGVCGATETLLVDAGIAASLLPALIADLAALGCGFRADARARAIVPTLAPIEPGDFDTEWLDAVLSVGIVDGVDDAVAHILRHGSGHTDAIVTADPAAADKFLAGVDSAVALWNASTQFCDGFEFGFGAEIGISTGRLHARGPVGLEQLTTYRYVVKGTGQIRN